MECQEQKPLKGRLHLTYSSHFLYIQPIPKRVLTPLTPLVLNMPAWPVYKAQCEVVVYTKLTGDAL